MAIYLTNNQPTRTQQRQSNMNPMQAWDMYQKFAPEGSWGTGGDSGGSWINNLFGSGSGGSSSSTGAGGMGSAGIFAIIAAAIAAQHAASENTDRKVEGHQVNDAFSGDFGTEPWFEWLGSKLGWEPSAGAKFDAAIGNGDYGLAAKRLPAMANYWANPAQAWVTSPAREYIGSDIDLLIDPASYLTRLFEDWF
jgi:hypothetical protein